MMTTIGPARPADMRDVAALRWAWQIDELGRPSEVGREAFVEGFVAWARRASSHTCFVAANAATIVGMAWLAVTPRVPAPRSLERRTGDLQSVYVVPSLRNQGIGTALVEAVKREAAARGLERLVVHSSPRAVGAYDRAGFASSDLLRDLTLG